MKIIGITGSSGSGKTTASQVLEKQAGISVIDCDKIAKNISVPGNKYLEAIKTNLGEEFFFKDGNLNRKFLAEAIYNNKEKLDKLNSLTFKYVVEEVLENIQELGKSNKAEIIVIDAPLLFESKLNEKCDYIISLIADRNLKIERICKRDNISKEMAEKRLNIQKDNSYYIEKSDFVIYNNDENELIETLDKILKKIKGN